MSTAVAAPARRRPGERCEARLADPAVIADLDLVRAFDGAVLMVSHDRYLLDETVTAIAELEHGRIRMWPGTYSAYAVAREVELLRRQQQYVTQQKEIARLEDAIRRFKDWANRVFDERHPTHRLRRRVPERRATSSARPTAWRRSSARCSSAGAWRSSCARAPVAATAPWSCTAWTSTRC